MLNTGSRLTGCVVVEHGLSYSLSTWDLPGPRVEAMSPALAGGFQILNQWSFREVVLLITILQLKSSSWTV